MNERGHLDLNGRTILVTGSPGFIGAALVMRLLKEMAAVLYRIWTGRTPGYVLL